MQNTFIHKEEKIKANTYKLVNFSFLFLVCILLISFSSATITSSTLEVGLDGSMGEIGVNFLQPFNFSSVNNVNSSDYWDDRDTPADITYDEISAGDVNALGYTGTFNFLAGVVGQLSMDGDPWYLAGTDLELAEELQVDGNSYLSDTFPISSLTYSLGSGALRWLNLFVQNINAEEIDTFNIHVSENLSVDGNATINGLINGINISEINIDNYLNLSGTNANQNINVSPYNITATDFYIPNMTGNNGVYSINDWFINSGSPGQLTGGNISAGGGITVDVSAGTGLFRDIDDDDAQLRSYIWDARSSITVPTNSIMYIGVDLNSGTPIIVNTTTDASWDLDTNFPLGSVINQADEIYIMNNPWRVADGLTNVIERFQAEGWLERDDNLGGLILGYTGTRQPTMTAGQLWSRLNEHPFDAFVGGTTFDYYYRDGAGGYTENSDETQWSTTLWDDGSGTLDTIDNNKYAVIYVWVNVASGKISLTYPQATYSNAGSAEAESVPNFPGIWYKGGVIIGRIIIQEGKDIPVEIQSAFSTVFTASLAADHGNLAGLTDDDHPQYLLADGTRDITGDITISGNITSTGIQHQLMPNLWTCQLTETSNPIITSNLTKSIAEGKC